MANTVLIVHDNSAIRRLMRSVIEQKAGWAVCGEAENSEGAIQKVQELHPDIVLLDSQMPVMNELEAARQISILAPATEVLVFTMHGTPEQPVLRNAHARGIKAAIAKSDAPSAALLAFVKTTRGK